MSFQGFAVVKSNVFSVCVCISVFMNMSGYVSELVCACTCVCLCLSRAVCVSAYVCVSVGCGT